MELIPLRFTAPGTTIIYHGRLATVLEHSHGGVLVQLNDSIEKYKFGATNDWRSSALRRYLNGEFAQELTEGNMDELLDTITDLTAMDGTTDYGNSVDRVALLTIDQCRKYRRTRPLPEAREWTSTPDGTPSSRSEDDAKYTWSLDIDGSPLAVSYSVALAVRPSFTLPNTLMVRTTANHNLANYTDAELLGELLKRQMCNCSKIKEE